MFKQYLTTIEGITSYPMFLVIAFFIFFTMITIAIMSKGKKQIKYLSELPLNDSNTTTEN